jgi:outer membrane autotransporter protein
MGATSTAMNLVSTRMAAIRGDSAILADNTEGVSAGNARGKAAWLRAFNTNNKQTMMSGYNGYKSGTYGFAGGSDVEIGNDRTVGVAFTYASTKVEQQDAALGNTTDVKSYGLTVYGAQQLGDAYVDGMIGFAMHENTGVRQSALSRTAKSNYNANQISARISSGYRFKLLDKVTFTPLTSLEVSNYNQAAYTENGADSLNLRVNSLSQNRIKGGLGFRITDEKTTSKGLVFRPEINAMVYKDFNDAGADVTSSFTGGGSSFVTTGQKIESVSYNLGTGVTFLQGKTGQLGVMFNYEGRKGFTGYNAQLQGRLAF